MKQFMKRFWISNTAGGCTAMGGAYRKIAVLLATVAVVVLAPHPVRAGEAGAARVCVFTPDTENVAGAEKAWLPGSVRDKLEADLRTYTAFVLIDRANEGKIKALQMKSVADEKRGCVL